MITYKQIEASRNVRLWVTQIGIPVASLAITVLIAFPEVRQAIGKKAVDIKNSVQNTFARKSNKNDKRIVIRIDAKNRNEALSALEVLAKQVFESKQGEHPIKKTVQIKDYRKA